MATPPLPAGYALDDTPPLPAGYALDSSASSEATRPNAYSKLTASYNPNAEEYAQKHPVLGPVVRFLDAAGGAALATPEGIYQALSHPSDTAKGALESLKAWRDPNVRAAALSVLPEALGQGIGGVSGSEALGAAGGLAKGAAMRALPSAETIAKAARTETGALKPIVKTLAKGAGVGVGGTVGGGWGALVGEHLGTNLADALIPERLDAATAAERRAVPLSKSPYPERVAQIEAARKAAAEGVPLSQLAQATAEPSGVTLVPEPRAAFAGETPNYMASVPRATLQDLALAGKPGAGTQIQQLGGKILYAPSGAGISNVKSAVALRDLLEAKPNMTLNPVGAGGARQIVPGNEFESLFGPEHKEVGDLAEWETGNREGVKVGSDLDKAAKSMFGGKSFDALTQAQKAHILRIAQTQVAVP